MAIVSRKRLSSAAIVAAGTLLLAGALPALAQTASQSPSSSTAGQSGAGGTSVTTPSATGGAPSGSSATTPSGPAAGQSSSQQQMESQKGKAPRAGAMTQSELRRYAKARMAVQQKAPDVYSKIESARDLNRELSAEERQKAQQALQGTGLTMPRFARDHQRVMASPRLQAQLQQIEKTQSGGGAPSTTGGAQPKTPSSGAGGQAPTQPSGSASPSK